MKGSELSCCENWILYIYNVYINNTFFSIDVNMPKRKTISPQQGTNPEQQASRKYNFLKKAKLQSAISKCHLGATKLLF